MENPILSQEQNEQVPNIRKALSEFLMVGPKSMAEGLRELSDATLGRLADGIIELAEKLKKSKERK